jgi:CRP/FNR family transcriptional regulator, nitrogen fixation regulation protein
MQTNACSGRASSSSRPRQVALNKTGESQTHALRSLDALAVSMRCSRGQEVCGSSRPADYWYRVVSGSVRRCVIRSDGRRQIVDLLLPGDYFGFSDRNEYDSTVEAVVEGTIVASYLRKRAEMMADTDPQLARELRHVAYKALARSRAHLLILGRITAREKVGAFLLELVERFSGGAMDTVMLPISRYDIADCLALSVETVCRSLTELKQRGVIALSGTRCVRIVDRQALEEGDRDSDAAFARRKPAGFDHGNSSADANPVGSVAERQLRHNCQANGFRQLTGT